MRGLDSRRERGYPSCGGGEMNNKKVFLRIGLGAVVLIPLLAFGQRKGDERKPPILQKDFLDELVKQLELNAEQKKKVGAVLGDARPRVLKSWKKLHRLKKKMEAARKEFKTTLGEASENIRGQLTLEQKLRFDEIRIRQQMRQRKHRGRRRGPRGIDFDLNDLPEEMRDRLRRGRGPPEMWQEHGRDRELPLELRKHIEKRRLRREQMPDGSQRDVPPPSEWHDQRREFSDD